MEVAIGKAKGRLCELVAAARKGERVVITRRGRPAAELVACRQPAGGIDFEKLEAIRQRLGIEGDGELWPEEWNDPAFSRQVLGLEDE